MKFKNILLKIVIIFITIFLVVGCGDSNSFSKSDENLTKKEQKKLIMTKPKQLDNKIDKSNTGEKDKKIDIGNIDSESYSEEGKPLNELMDEEKIKIENNTIVPDEEVDDIIESKSEEEISDEELSNVDNKELNSDSDDKSNIQIVNSKSKEELEDEVNDK